MTSILDFVVSAVKFLVPDRIEDDSNNTTLIKLLAGIITGLFLIAIAFASLTSFSHLVIEKLGGWEVSNATIYIFFGALLIWLTLTRVGLKKDENQK
jgi:hypothetical protein